MQIKIVPNNGCGASIKNRINGKIQICNKLWHQQRHSLISLESNFQEKNKRYSRKIGQVFD